VILVAAVGCSAAVAPAAHAAPRTVIFDLFPSPVETPDSIFLTANSGPYIEKVSWAGWGTAKAVGTGTFVDNSGAPAPVPKYPATYTLTDPGPCPRLGSDVTSYRGGVISYKLPDGTKRTINFPSDYDFCAKRPTVAAATKAIKVRVGKRGAVTRFSVKCKNGYDGTYLDCTARFTQKGKRRARSFTVFGRMNKGPGLVG
jgi:hypothetical protein